MSVLRRVTSGHRKVIVFFGAASYLIAGLWLCLRHETVGVALYATFAGAVVPLVGIFTWGNVKEAPKPEPRP